MGIFSDMGKSGEKTELPKEEKKYKQEYKKQRKGIVSLVIKGNRVILDVDGNGESIPYNQREHENLKIGDVLIIT